MNIYVVADGEYSDYHICGIYSTKELAEDAKRLYCAERDIEEYCVDSLPDHPAGCTAFQVIMDVNGNIHGVYPVGIDDAYEYHEGQPYERFCCMSFVMWARDDHHAIKIAAERRAKYIALNLWETEWDRWNKRGLKDIIPKLKA